MNILTPEKKNFFLNTIITLRDELNLVPTNTTVKALEQFENQLTLNELEACFFDSPDEEFNSNLIHLFAKRWERIRDPNISIGYTQNPTNLVNQLSLELAKAISPPATTVEEIKKLAPNTGPYCLLMPSIETCEDVYGGNIHSLGLHEFILSDNGRVFIPLAECLHQASLSEEGTLRHLVMINGCNPELTPSEVNCVFNHSTQASRFYQAIEQLNNQRLLSEDIGAKLSQLAKVLRNGGEHSGQLGSGSQMNAGSAANIGIIAFSKYWDVLTEQQKTAIFAETPALQDIIGRLFRPIDSNYEQTRFCVESLASALDPIIEIYNNKPNIAILKERVQTKENVFRSELKKGPGLVNIQNGNPPKHILHLIFKLSLDEQKKLFPNYGYKNAFMYALEHDPEALSEFELDEASKQQVISARMEPGNDSVLIVAAKHGTKDSIKLLLSWGAEKESHDKAGLNALHWTARKGDIDTTNYLLENGFRLEALTYNKNTVLNIAVSFGNRAVVELLLKKEASLNARNEGGQNALDIAIEQHPELVEPIIMKLATLPIDKQAECLSRVRGGPYPNAFFYAAAKNPGLFSTLTTQVLGQLSKETRDGILQASGVIGWSALHWAVAKEDIVSINCLLENGSRLEALSNRNNTPLNLAVAQGRHAVVDLLFKKNANLNARNEWGKNALDIAIEECPELVEPIVIQLATLPSDKQTECLLHVSAGIHEDVRSFIALEKPSLLPKFLSKETSEETIKITDRLSDMHFDKYLHTIIEHYQKMQKKSQKNSNYNAATSAAKTLLKECIKAKIELYKSDGDIDEKVVTFQKACKSAIEKAKIDLKHHREWVKVLPAFLLSVVTLPVSLPLYALGLFSVKTKSNQLLDKFQKSIDKPNSSC